MAECCEKKEFDKALNPSNDSTSHEHKKPHKTWVKFEDETLGENVATIKPSETIQVDSHNTLHPLADVMNATNDDVIHDIKQASASCDRKSPSPQLSSADNPALSPNNISPPTAPVRPIRKSPSETPVKYVPNSSQGNDLQSISLGDVAAASQRQCNHGVRQGFCNGDVIVTLLPVNSRCAWVTKAEFKPELVPEELMAPGLTLTVEDHVMAMQVLVNDVRFNLYIVCYKRVLLLWIMLGFIILLSLLFSGVRGLALFGGGIVWLVVNAIGIFVCMWLKIKLYRMLEQCVASVNALLYKHHVLIGLDDRGKISCHKVNLIFIYFDVTYCIKYLKDMLENEEILQTVQQPSELRHDETRGQQTPIDHSRMDIDTSDIIITGSNTTRVSQKEKYAEKLFLRYSQRWVKEFIRKRLDLNLPLHPDGTEESGPPSPPRHCSSARCPCQFIEEHLRFKPHSKCSIRELFS